MYQDTLIRCSFDIVPDDPEWDLEFAERAAGYLAEHGLPREAVVQCLVEECGIDYETARLAAA